MKVKKVSRIVLALLISLTLLPFNVFASVDFDINGSSASDDYYNLIQKQDWEIAPGISESKIVLNNDAGTYQQVLHVMEADLNNDYVKVINSYNGMIPKYGDYKVGVMSKQAAYAEANGYGNVVGAMNTTLSWYTGYPNDRVNEPLGFIMLDAEVLFDPGNCGYEYGNVGFPSVLVINKDYDEDGNPRPADIPKVEMPQIRTAADLDGWEEQVIPASSGYIVKDGVNQAAKPDHSSAAPRSVVGIKPDGKVVIMLNDGRQSPYSAGMSMYELAEVMIGLGCSYAVNCDGGGSSTYLSQRPGEELKVNNSPSDGAERDTTTGILFISTAPATGEFVRANIETEQDYDYYTPNSVVKFKALGTDLVGTEAAIPADAKWQLEDSSFGTIENGVFTSTGKEGEVTVQLVYNGEVVGEDTIYIVMPDKVAFAQANMVVPFNKTVDIKIDATYDSKPVCIKIADVKFTLSDKDLGTIDGFKFTSAPEGTVVAPGTLTAKIGELEIEANLSLGKGSEIAYDFEDQNIEGWSITTNYPQYGPTGPNNNVKDPDGKYWYNGQNELGNLKVVDDKTGKVRNGNYALAIECDFSQIYETGFHSLNMKFPKIDTTDAVSVGFWIYVPYDARHSDLTINSVLGEKFFADGSAMELCEGWHYVKLNAPNAEDGFYDISISADDRASGKDALGNTYYDHINTPNLNGKYTFYIDDITVDYSTAVDDRENPVFEKPMVLDSVGSLNAVMSGQTIKFNNPTFEVKVSDFKADNATGIDASSAKAYVDGKAVDCTYANNKISVNGVVLADGVHSVKFEISDNAGNSSWAGGTVNVEAETKAPTVKVVPQEPDADRLLVGSVYWMDVVASDIETIDKVEMRFDLNNASYWELEGMTTAVGFDADWSVQSDDNIATITIERTGNNDATGEEVIASIPVRTWESHITEYPGYEDQTPATLVKRGIIWAQSIELTLEKGVITYVDSYKDATSGTFGMENVLVDTELFFTNYTRKSVDGAQAWIDEHKAAGTGFHEHTVANLDDKAATCTKDGYSDRTYCEVCKSVVEWGTVEKATGHKYEFVDGVLKCTCDKLFNGLHTDGKTYIDGKVIPDGWVDESYYKDGVKLVGVHQIEGKYYKFDENGVCAHKYPMSAEWWTNEDGESFYFNVGVPVTGYNMINGTPTNFDKNGVAFDGTVEINGEACVFEKGAFVKSTTADVKLAGLSGPNAYFVLYADGTMVLCGEGETYDYSTVGANFGPNISWKNRPWGKQDHPMAKSIKKVVVGKDITEIGVYTFYLCTNISEVVFEKNSNLSKIDGTAFCYLPYLKEIDIPDSVKTIASSAFSYCDSLENVRIPQGIKSISSTTFKNSKKVVLNVTEGTYGESYAKNNNIPYVTRAFVEGVVAEGMCGETATWTLYESGKLVIDGSGAMDDYTSQSQQPWAEYRNQIKSIEIGKDITTVGQYAFAFAHYVESVVFEEGSKLEKVGAVSFYYMVYVKEIKLPETVTKIGNLGLAYNSELKDVYIPQGVSSIHAQAFKKSPNVTLNVAEESYAETYAVKNNIAYTTRPFVESVVAEGMCGENATWTLYGSGKLVIDGSGAMDDYTSQSQQPWAEYRNQIKSIEIGKDITTVGQYAFAFAHYVESVVFEEGSKLEKVGAVSFYYMVYVKEIKLPETVTKIGNLGLAYNSELKDVYIPQGVSSIHAQAFKKSPNVTLNVAEESYAETYAVKNNIAYTTRPFVESVVAEGKCGENATWTLYESGKLVIDGSGAMDNYTIQSEQPWADYRLKIKKIVIGKDITTVGQYAFAYAHYVESVVFEEGSKLERVGAVSFYYMIYVKEIKLPETVTRIDNLAFAYCDKLTSVDYPTDAKVHKDAFKKSPVDN